MLKLMGKKMSTILCSIFFLSKRQVLITHGLVERFKKTKVL